MIKFSSKFPQEDHTCLQVQEHPGYSLRALTNDKRGNGQERSAKACFRSYEWGMTYWQLRILTFGRLQHALAGKTILNLELRSREELWMSMMLR